MDKPKYATHELNGTYYQKSYGVEIYRQYSKKTGKLMNTGHCFKKDSPNKPVPI